MNRGFLVAMVMAVGCGGATAGSEPTPEGQAGAGQAGASQAGAGQAGRACPGLAPASTPGETRCRTADDCAPDLWCQSTPPSECALGFPTLTCASDADCPLEARCVEVGPPSCFGQGRSTGCAAACVENSCAEGELCDADGHCRPARCEDDELVCQQGFACRPGDEADVNGCAPISCHDGYECPVNERCGDAAPFYHQCETLSCAEDADCDCGYCISGRCSSALHYCAKPPIG